MKLIVFIALSTLAAVAFGQSTSPATQAQVAQQAAQIRQQIQQMMSQLPPQQQQQARRVFAPILAAINRAPSMMSRPSYAGNMASGMAGGASSMMNRPVRQADFLPIETRYFAGGINGGFAQNQRLEQMLTQALTQLNSVSNQLSSLQGSGRLTGSLTRALELDDATEEEK